MDHVEELMGLSPTQALGLGRLFDRLLRAGIALHFDAFKVRVLCYELLRLCLLRIASGLTPN